MRIDLLEQYVGGLRTRYGYTVNEKLLKQALGPQTEQPQDTRRLTGRPAVAY